MYISNNKYRLAQLTYEHLPKTSKLLTETFLLENKIWAQINPHFKQVQKFMYDKTFQMLQWQEDLRQNGIISSKTFLNFVYLDQNDQIIAVQTNFELIQYLERKSKVRLQSFSILQNYRPHLQQTINSRDLEAGKCIYMLFVGIKRQFIGSGVSMLFVLDTAHYLNSQGFRVLYARTSNEKPVSFIKKHGGFVTAKMRVTEIPDKQLYLSMIKWYLDPIHYLQPARRQILRKSRL